MESIKNEISVRLKRIEAKLEDYQREGKKLFCTSSFQTHSLPMLHILSRIDKSIPVYFINTGFHFTETLKFRDEIAHSFGLKIIDHFSATPRNLQRDSKGAFYFTSDPDYCCYLNKVQPIEPIMAAHDIWINGIRADQNANRKSMLEEQPAPNGKLRYHPMLDWNSKHIYYYAKENKLPFHPLEAKGYLSIGCEPCTRKHVGGDDRTSRWFGMKKTECGLHTELVKK